MKQYTDIEVRTYQMHRHNRVKHLLIDVREPEEFMLGHIPGSINVPLSELPAYIPNIPCEQLVVVVCTHSVRSIIAARYLAEAGHTGVYNLVGGTAEWIQRGLDIEI